MNKFNVGARTNLTVVASNNLNEGAFQTNQRGIEATRSHYYSVSTRWDGAKRVQLSAIEYATCTSVYIGLNVFAEYNVRYPIRECDLFYERGIFIDGTFYWSPPISEHRVRRTFVIQMSWILLLRYSRQTWSNTYIAHTFHRTMKTENYSRNFSIQKSTCFMHRKARIIHPFRCGKHTYEHPHTYNLTTV